MAGKRQLLLYCENTNFLSFANFGGVIARQNVSGFRKVHLPSQTLHLAIVQAASIGEHGKRITCEWCLREYIKLNEVVSAVLHKKTSQSVPERSRRTVIFWQRELLGH